jgi:hypothetical protein
MDSQRTRKPATAARVYDYYLDGLRTFPADQRAVEAVITPRPSIPAVAQANQAFLTRAVRLLIDAGIRQFLDVGAGGSASASNVGTSITARIATTTSFNRRCCVERPGSSPPQIFRPAI